VLTVLLVLAVVTLLAAAVGVADRVVAGTAERKAAEYLSTPFGHPATVRVHGRPFLTQAIRGRYAHVEVLGTLRVGQINGAAVVAHLSNAYLPLRELLGGRAAELPCEAVRGRLVLPYAGLAGLAPIPGLGLHFEGERLMASAALPVPGISQLARVTGEAMLTLGPGGAVWLRIRGVSVAGLTLPGLVLNQLLPTLNVPLPLPDLPFGLRLDDVRPSASGLVVDGSAEAVVLRRPTLQDGRPVT
jgi:hypothetical protein